MLKLETKEEEVYSVGRRRKRWSKKQHKQKQHLQQKKESLGTENEVGFMKRRREKEGLENMRAPPPHTSAHISAAIAAFYCRHLRCVMLMPPSLANEDAAAGENGSYFFANSSETPSHK